MGRKFVVVKQMTLREARRLRGMTQEQLEDATGVQQAAISKLERGINANPGYETIRKLEAALKLKPGVLVFGDTPSQAERVERTA